MNSIAVIDFIQTIPGLLGTSLAIPHKRRESSFHASDDRWITSHCVSFDRFLLEQSGRVQGSLHHSIQSDISITSKKFLSDERNKGSGLFGRPEAKR
jgi:hypothetical protein